MDTIVRAAAIYIFLLVLFRITGRRALAQITTFDLLLLLIISEATQQGMLGDDFSVTNAFLAILTMIGLDLLLQAVSSRWRLSDRWSNGLPLVLVENVRSAGDRLKKSGFQEDEIMQRARQTQGLERMDQIKHVVLERDGSIPVIPHR